ncbi:MAG: fibronectin type III-like domain-contianing protein, partial [Muribaculaceae bacterium]|nr:fibronectin type III-like domain-contianing protein [Muribaculaceae bacterium]
IVQGWYLGSMGGNSLASVLSGEVNPSGKLPFSFPVKLEDCGAHSFGDICYPGDSTALKEQYLDDILVGYRWYDTKKIPALFPFGHGMSYTEYEYGKPLQSSKEISGNAAVEVSVPVKNIGNFAGKEVVQLYVGDDKASVLRPVKELKHFSKVALEPGEEKTVTFTVTPDDLKFYDDVKGEWVVEPGKFTLYIGASSADIRHTLPLTYK